uniref:PI3K/PI4K catalytic domain-containing protein n=1 Tax=Fagus sylvatica TaxID=28930 RepID=A0A2N9HTH2_FAGSY
MSPLSHILDIRCIPEALPYFVTPKAVDENSALLQQLPHWAACSITQALEFLTPAYKGHPRVMAYVLRVLESYPPERVTFFMPQLVQALRYDEENQGKMLYLERELEKIELEGEDLYLPTATNKLVKGIRVDSGIPLQSAAKVPIMITFNVVDRNGDHNDIKPQACIFKDVLALQVIALLRDIFEAVGLNLCLFPYGVLPTGPERGIIEVVPNTRSRSQMGETTDGAFSSAGYAVASLLLQPKDRHNGNLLFDNLCVMGYLAARRYMDGIINTVLLMLDSGLPCFSRGDPIGNLCKRFHPEVSEHEAANFMIPCVQMLTTSGQLLAMT